MLPDTSMHQLVRLCHLCIHRNKEFTQKMRQITSLLIFLNIANLTAGQSCPDDPNTSNSPALPLNSAVYKCNSKKTKCHFECTGSGKSFYNPTNLKYKSNGYLTCENGVFKSNLGKSWGCENVPRCHEPDLVLEKNNNKWKTFSVGAV